MSNLAHFTIESTLTTGTGATSGRVREGFHVGGNYSNPDSTITSNLLGRLVEGITAYEASVVMSRLDNSEPVVEEFYIEYDLSNLAAGYTVVLRMLNPMANERWETIKPPHGDYYLYRDEASFSTTVRGDIEGQSVNVSTWTWNLPRENDEALQIFRLFYKAGSVLSLGDYVQHSLLTFTLNTSKVYPLVSDQILTTNFSNIDTEGRSVLYDSGAPGHYCQVNSYGTINNVVMYTNERTKVQMLLSTDGQSLGQSVPISINNAEITATTTNCTIADPGTINNLDDPLVIEPLEPGNYEAQVTYAITVHAKGNCETYTTPGDPDDTIADTGQTVYKIVTIRGQTLSHRRSAHVLGDFTYLSKRHDRTDGGNPAFGVVDESYNGIVETVPYAEFEGEVIKNLDEDEHDDIFTIQGLFRRQYGKGVIRDFYMVDYQTFISPDIYDDDYSGLRYNCRIYLRMDGRQPNSGWESIFSNRKYLSLNRDDAAYRTISERGGQVNEDITEWTWYANLSLKEFYHFFADEDPVYDTLRGSRPGLGKIMNATFSGKKLNKKHTHLLQKDMSDIIERNGQGYHEGPNLLDSNDILPLGFYLDNVAITDATYNPLAPQIQNSTFPNLGPRIHSTENCRIYGSVEKPTELSTTATGSYFKVNEHIIGTTAPSSSEEEVTWSNKLNGRKILSRDGSFKATITNASYTTGTLSGIIGDIDLNGNVDALTDGLMLLRYAFNLRGEVLISGAIAEGALRRTADQIESYLEDPTIRDYLDLDNSGGAIDALTDGLLLLRYLFNLRGLVLVDGAIATAPDGSLYATTEEVTANLEEVTTQSIILGSDLLPYSGSGDLAGGDGSSSNESTITYSVDLDSVREVPAYDDDLYIELEPGDELNNIQAFGPGGGTSTFKMTRWELAQKVTRMSTHNDGYLQSPDGTAALQNKYGSPMLLLTAINPGAYQVALDVHCNKRVEDEAFKAKFTVQGFAGPTKTVNITNTNESPQADETVRKTVALNDVGDLLKVNIKDLTAREDVPGLNGLRWTPTHADFTVKSVNCTVTGLDKAGESLSKGGPFSALVVPHAGSERYRATFTRNHLNFRDKVFIVEGPVRSSATEHQITYANPLSTTQFDQVSNIPNTVQGSNLRLVFKLNTDYTGSGRAARVASLRGLYCTAEFLPDSSFGGHMVRSSGPLKLRDGDEDSVTDIIFDSAIFKPTAANFQCAVRLTINFPETLYDDAITREYVGTWIGSYEGDFGLETVANTGRTRMNTNSLPLKFVSSASGEFSIAEHQDFDTGQDVLQTHTIQDVEELDNGFASGFYADPFWSLDNGPPGPDNPPKYLYVHSFPARRSGSVPSTFSIWWEGQEIIKNVPAGNVNPERIGYSWEYLDPPNSNILGPYYQNATAIIEASTVTDDNTTATYQVGAIPFSGVHPSAQDDFNDYYNFYNRSHFIDIEVMTLRTNVYMPINDTLFNNEDSYAVINNRSFSMVSAEQEVNNNRYKLTITDWDHGPEYANFGSQLDPLKGTRDNRYKPLSYSLMVLKIE